MPVKNHFLPLGYFSPSWFPGKQLRLQKEFCIACVDYTDRKQTLEYTLFFFPLSYSLGHLLIGCCQNYLWLTLLTPHILISHYWVLSKWFWEKGPVCASYIFSVPIHLCKWYQIKDLPHLHLFESPWTKHCFHRGSPTTKHGLVSTCKVSWIFLPPSRPVML